MQQKVTGLVATAVPLSVLVLGAHVTAAGGAALYSRCRGAELVILTQVAREVVVVGPPEHADVGNIPTCPAHFPSGVPQLHLEHFLVSETPS